MDLDNGRSDLALEVMFFHAVNSTSSINASCSAFNICRVSCILNIVFIINHIIIFIVRYVFSEIFFSAFFLFSLTTGWWSSTTLSFFFLFFSSLFLVCDVNGFWILNILEYFYSMTWKSLYFRACCFLPLFLQPFLSNFRSSSWFFC